MIEINDINDILYESSCNIQKGTSKVNVLHYYYRLYVLSDKCYVQDNFCPRM